MTKSGKLKSSLRSILHTFNLDQKHDKAANDGLKHFTYLLTSILQSQDMSA